MASVAGHDFERRQQADQLGRGTEFAARGNGAHVPGVLRHERAAILGLPPLEQRVVGLERPHVPFRVGAGHQHAGATCNHRGLHVDTDNVFYVANL
jgi:hypothetical protein